MSARWKRRLLLSAGRHRKQVTEGEIQRARETLARWKGIGVGEIFR